MKSSFVDLQVNGFLGVSFTSLDFGPADVLKVADELERRGTGAFLPTVVTTTQEVYAHSLPALAEFIESPEAKGRLLGIHLEGPFISPEDGAVGAHPKPCVAAPSPAAFDKLQKLAKGHVKLLTVAPEMPGAMELIRHAASQGVAVSIGHTMAAERDVMAAVEAGATLSTHLGNGVPNMVHRHLNPIVAQLGAPSLVSMIITDGHHLPPPFIRMVLAARGVKGALVVSDAASVAGMPPGEYEFLGTRVRVCEDGAVRNLNAPTLAGSSSSMFECMNFLASAMALDEKSLWALGRDNPLRAIGLAPSKAKLPKSVSFEGGRFILSRAA